MNETILVVDDELSSRSFARDALQAHGYTVLDTDEPQQALQILRGQPVHLLVVDVLMPLMRGTVLADRAQAIRPSLKVLLVSGHPTSAIGPSGHPFLAKPFTIEALASAVRDLLAPALARPKPGGDRIGERPRPS
jgi:two-component system cell cycle sensor histidine kinase/response regulator CckA